jgi:LPS-assembly lipoprotein
MSQAASSISSFEDRAPARPDGQVLTRRGLLSAGAALALSGCGFRPLNAPVAAADSPDDVAVQLAAVRVGLVPERNGQLLRRALESRLAARNRTSPAARYELRVTLLPGSEAQGYRRDGSPSRVRTTITAPWTLSTLSVPPEQVITGTARAIDAYNIPDNEFFAAIASAEAADRRMIDRVAEDIILRLTLAFRERPAG